MSASAQNPLVSSSNQELARILVANPVGSSYVTDPSRPLIFLDRQEFIRFCAWQLRAFTVDWSKFRRGARDIYSACADLTWPALILVDVPNRTLVHMGGVQEILQQFGK